MLGFESSSVAGLVCCEASSSALVILYSLFINYKTCFVLQHLKMLLVYTSAELSRSLFRCRITSGCYLGMDILSSVITLVGTSSHTSVALGVMFY